MGLAPQGTSEEGSIPCAEAIPAFSEADLKSARSAVQTLWSEFYGAGGFAMMLSSHVL